MSKLLLLLLTILISCNEEKKTVEKIDKPKDDSKSRIVFFGDSLTAGLGLASIEESYPFLIGKKLEKDGYQFKIVNAGLSGDTTSGGLSRLDWAISKGVSVFILELGANDGMRGVPTETIEKNLKEIISKVKNKFPEAKIVLIPMKTFPNMGAAYSKKFEKVFLKVASDENITLTKFLLERVAGIKNLNQADGIHPTAEGHKLMAETIYSDIIKVIKTHD
ncbi:MAG: arylesterase [Leptospiraceae bacterium]|nr:arylesterase [Leptospiraceae bacterium]